MRLEFTVYGVAQPMGTKRAFMPKGWTRPILTDSNRSLKSWQLLVREAANAAIHQLPAHERGLLLGGVRLTLACYLPRPQLLPKRVTAHTKAPDLDKLTRGLADALTQVVYRDDSQIVELVASKHYAPSGDVPHMDIKVEAVEEIPRAVPLFAEAGIAKTGIR
jgi:crossover junction endodeoxyribonuclease RusA